MEQLYPQNVSVKVAETIRSVNRLVDSLGSTNSLKCFSITDFRVVNYRRIHFDMELKLLYVTPMLKLMP